MPVSPGRNSTAENLRRTLTGYARVAQQFFLGQTAPLTGNNVAFSAESLAARNYDEEAIGFPVRDPFRAAKLHRIGQSPEIAAAVDIIRDDTFSSEAGDSSGFRIGQYCFDGVTPVNPEFLRIGNRCISRIFRGGNLDTIVEDFLRTGDSFRSIQLDEALTRVVGLQVLPTWEMFRVEDNNGQVLRFEQRRTRSLEVKPEFTINPVICVHWRYRRLRKYGRALFEESEDDVLSLLQGYRSLERAASAVGINPNIHVMPTGSSDKTAEAYKTKHDNERARQQGMITDYYLLFGGDVRKMGGSSDVNALISNVAERRQRLNMRSRVPPWMMGIPSAGAKDISGQPALAYSRFIGAVRATFAEGVRQVIDLEFALNGFKFDDLDYEIVFPKIYTEIQQQSLGSSGNSYNNEAPATLPEPAAVPAIASFTSTMVRLREPTPQKHTSKNSQIKDKAGSKKVNWKAFAKVSTSELERAREEWEANPPDRTFDGLIAATKTNDE